VKPPMDDAAKAAGLRSRAREIRDQAKRAQARAAKMPPGLQRDMLAAQAGMLSDGAAQLETQALALDPAMGNA
jgi:hypothetical protein